jgi:hypothetical protein
MGWLYVVIAVITGGSILVNYLILMNDAEKNDQKVKQMALAQFGIGLVLAFATYYATDLDGRQKDRIEELGKLNNELAKHIESLSSLNNKISNTIQSNTQNTQASVSKNISLTDSVNKLTKAIQLLISLSRNENKEGFAKNTISGEFDFRFKKTYYPNDILYMDYGTNISGDKASSQAFRAKEGQLGEPFRLYVKGNRLMINAKIYDNYHNLLFEVKDNKWRANTHIYNKINFDSRGVEVIDDLDLVRLSIDIISDTLVKVRGIFADGPTMVNVVSDAGSGTYLLSDPKSIPDLINAAEKTKKLFSYTGNHWIGKRNPDLPPYNHPLPKFPPTIPSWMQHH